MRRLAIAFIVALVSTVLVAQTFAPLVPIENAAPFVSGNVWHHTAHAEQTRQNFNALVAPQYWVGTADGNLTNEKNVGVLSTGFIINTAGVPTAYAGSTCATGYASAASASGVLTCDNFIELTALPRVVCQNTTTVHTWSLPTSNPAVAACVTGTNTQQGVLQFADSANLSAQTVLRLPTDFTSTIDAAFKWRTSATTGSVVWQVATICVADAETSDPAFNAASVVIDAAKGTTLQTNDAAVTTVTITGCAAGELMYIKVFRDAAHGSDNLAATAELFGVVLTIRRAI